jgi:putative ABC transport system ATP-binding protein
LLNVLGLLDKPTVGSYELNGVATTKLSDRERARLRGASLGFVFQAFHLLARRTVFQNVLLGMAYSGVERKARVERAREALAAVRLEHRASFTPATLSGGERQRVALARAIAARPSLLLADEPTGNLDRGTSEDVMDTLDELHASGLSLVVITHDPQVAARAGRRLQILDGRLWEEL